MSSGAAGEAPGAEARPRSHPSATATAFGAALALHFLAYRLALGVAIAGENRFRALGMLGWNEAPPVPLVLAAGLRDLPLLFGLGAAVAAAAWLGRRAPRGFAWLGRAALVALLLVVGLAGAANRRMAIELGSGLDLPSLLEAGTALGGADVRDFVTAGDLALALSAPLLFLLLAPLLDRRPAAGVLRGLRRAGVLGLAALAAALPGPGRGEMWIFVRDHPLSVVAGQLAALGGRPAGALEPLAAAAGGRPGFVDPALVDRLPEPRASATPPPERGTSLLFVVLESVAARRLADPGPGGERPMPALERLAAESWWLAEHRASSTSSDSAAFGLFTGLYSPPNPVPSVASPRLRTRAIWSRLRGLDAFLVTPARLDGYFPLGMLRNDGLEEIVDFFALEPTARRPHPDAARNELDGADALVERLVRTRGRRFFATYWIDAAHLPYFDHDPERRWIAEPADERERYLNGLRVADRVLERALAALAAAGHADDTLVVVVGDHGEAFGEHGDYAHRAAWEEVLHVPALLRLPGRIAPRVDRRPSSHVDLVPTILDLLGEPYEPLDFQGESLLAERLRRRYLFATGGQGVVVSWSGAGRKLVWSWVDGDCAAYDLARDPGELRPAPCADEDPQLRTLRRFHAAQRGVYARLAAGGADGR